MATVMLQVLFWLHATSAWITIYEHDPDLTHVWEEISPPDHYFLCGLKVSQSTWKTTVAQRPVQGVFVPLEALNDQGIFTGSNSLHGTSSVLGISDLSVIWCNEFDNDARANKITQNVVGTGTDEILCPGFQMIDGIQAYTAQLHFFNQATFTAMILKGNEDKNQRNKWYICETIYDIVYMSPAMWDKIIPNKLVIADDRNYRWNYLTEQRKIDPNKNELDFNCKNSDSIFTGDPYRGDDTCWCESPFMIYGLTKLDLRCRDQYEQPKSVGETKTTPEYVSGSAQTGTLTADAEQFICGIQVATDPVTENNKGIYGIKIKYCPVVRCELLLLKVTGATSSRTEKLIEGDTKYVYLDIFPNLIENLDISKDCGILACKLLNKCIDGDELTENIKIISDYRIEMDTDPANEYQYELCVSCSNSRITVKSETFFLKTYYPCEDELIKSSTLPKELDMVRKIIEEKIPQVDTRAIFPDYLVNSDPQHCPIENCQILQKSSSTVISAANQWADISTIYIQIVPVEEFYSYVYIECKNRYITVQSSEFIMQSYYPCEDELKQRASVPNIAEHIVPMSAGVYGETTVQKNIMLDYLVNSDPDHCLVSGCKLLQAGIDMADKEFIWIDIDTEYISINTDPYKEFYYNSLQVQCSNRNTTVTSLEFNIESTCTSNINVWTPPGFVASQTYDATTNELAKSKFLFDSFKTTTSACQVETYYVQISLTNKNYPSGMKVFNSFTDQYTLGSENANSFQLPVLDGSAPSQFNFLIYVEVYGGSKWSIGNLVLKTQCPTDLEFYDVSYFGIDSYKAAPIADSLYTFLPTIPTLPRCNEVTTYGFTLISYEDLMGNALSSTSSTLEYYQACSSSPCRTLSFDTTQTAKIIFTIIPTDTKSKAKASGQIEINIFENQMPPRIFNYLLYAVVTDGDANKQKTNPSMNMFVGEQNVFMFQPFQCTSGTCVVENYQLSSSGSSLVTPNGITGPSFNSVTGKMEIKVNNQNALGTYELFIYANLKLFPQVKVYSNKVTITVQCGNEVVSVFPTKLVLPVYKRNDGFKTIKFSDGLLGYFSSSKSACPITKFIAYSQALKLNIWSNPLVKLLDATDLLSTRLEISTSSPLKLSIFLEAKTDDKVSGGSLEIQATVCGNEFIHKNKSPNALYVKQIGETLEFSHAVYSTYFSSIFNSIDSDSLCTHIKKYSVYEGNSCTGASSLIQMVGDTIKVHTSSPFSLTQFCIKAVTFGDNSETQIFSVEVCGLEKPSFSSKNGNSISKVYTRDQIPQKISIADEGFDYVSSSQNCGIQSLKRLVEPDFSTSLTLFQFVSNNIMIQESLAYDGIFYLEARTILNKAYLPIHLKICGYEKVEIFENSLIELEYMKTDYRQEINYRDFFKSNDSSCEITQFQIFDEKTAKLYSQSDFLMLDKAQKKIIIQPQLSNDLYLAEIIEFYLQASTGANQMAEISFKISLSPKIRQEVLTKLVNFGPHFNIQEPSFLFEYYPELNIDPVTKKLKKQVQTTNLPLIYDTETDKILDLTQVTYFKLINKSYQQIETLKLFSFDCSVPVPIGQKNCKIKQSLINTGLSDAGKYMFKLELQDIRGASQIETVFYELFVSDLTTVSLKDIKKLSLIDYNFSMSAKPICKKLNRVHSVDISFNCTVGSDEEDIWLDLIEPSLQINMPSKDFYASLDPEIGFSQIIGTLKGSNLTEQMTARMKRGEKQVEFSQMIQICVQCVKYEIKATCLDGIEIIMVKQLSSEKDVGLNGIAVKADKNQEGAYGITNEYLDNIVENATVSAVIHPQFYKIALITIQNLKVLRLSFSKKMVQLSLDQIKLLQKVLEIYTISKGDDTKFKANWVIEGDQNSVETNLEVTQTEAYKKLRFNCTYHSQDANNLYFKIDFQDPLSVSQSIFGKDKIGVKILPNEMIKDSEGIPLLRFNEEKVDNLDPQPFSWQEQQQIEDNLKTAQLLIIFLQANMLILNILLSKSLQDLWGMLNTQQITIHMMLFRCSYTVPSNMFIFNSFMSQLTQKDMYPSDEIFSVIFNFTEKDSPIEQFESLGYEGANFVSMTGSLLINIIISVCLSIFLRFLDFCFKQWYRYKFARKFGSKIQHSSAIGGIITIYLQGFLEMLICIVVSLGAVNREDFEGNASDRFAALFAIFSVFILGFLLYLIIYIVKFDKNEPGLMSELYRYIYQDNSMQTKWQKLFMWLFLMRRAIFVCIIYFLEPFLGLQLILHIILTMLYMSYFAVVKPYSGKQANKWEIFNEICVVLVSYTLMFLSQYDEDIEIRQLIGWTYVFFISFNIFCNAYKIFKKMIFQSWPECYHTFIKNKNAKEYERKLKQWIDDKILFCSEHPEIAMTAEIHEIAEITQFQQETGKKMKIQKDKLCKELEWLQRHNLPTKVLDQEFNEVFQFQEEFKLKNLQLLKLNRKLAEEFNKIDGGLRARGIRQAQQEQTHKLEGNGITFQQVVLAIDQQKKLMLQNYRRQGININPFAQGANLPPTNVSLAAKSPFIENPYAGLFKDSASQIIEVKVSKGQKKGKKLKKVKKKKKLVIGLNKSRSPLDDQMNIYDEFELQNLDIDQIMTQNSGQTPKFGKKKKK